MRNCDIEASKVTHFRKSGVDYGASNGLSSQEVQTGTKHSGPGTSKLDSAYMPELLGELLHVMSGFSTKETYLLPRAQLYDFVDLPWKKMAIVKSLFPRLADWMNEIVDTTGDKAGEYFVESVIPNMCDIIVQDVIYWILDFPRHPVSQLLIDRL